MTSFQRFDANDNIHTTSIQCPYNVESVKLISVKINESLTKVNSTICELLNCLRNIFVFYTRVKISFAVEKQNLIIIIILSAVLAIAAITYNEVSGQERYNDVYVHGWSAFVAWAGASELCIAAISAAMLLFIKPSRSSSVVNVHDIVYARYCRESYEMS